MRRPLRNSNDYKLAAVNHDHLDVLPDDLVVFILCKLSSTASSPSQFVNVLLTCKRLKRLGLSRLVLAKAGERVFEMKAANWSDYAHRFLKRCVNAGNVDATYTLGMIQFYCFQNRGSGISLLASAASKYHAPSLYSLAVTQFNGSGSLTSEKNLKAGVALCLRAAITGHIGALRELGHCLQDGYGVRQNIAEGRRLLVHANVRELALVAKTKFPTSPSTTWHVHRQQNATCRFREPVCPLLSDYGFTEAVPEMPAANRFMMEWFESSGRGALGEGLRLCHGGCGRSETRPLEFRRCSVCGKVNYCSRGCQAIDWKVRHKMECFPVEYLVEQNVGGNIAAIGDENVAIG
ncbi:F-box protein [Senna tora]|uniref:F-box protein n=1 Tax=Senna tora TaxID=362788 RepID=A0A834X7D5_9FABA|nr:F-box protein [Senna tora]